MLVADYWLVRRRRLDIDALYSEDPAAAYWYRDGWNPAALAALAAGAAPCLPGLAHSLLGVPVAAAWRALYSQAWALGFCVAAAVYLGAMRQHGAATAAAAEAS